MAAAWLLLVAVCCGAAVHANNGVGGPPPLAPPFDQRGSGYVFMRPRTEVPQLPLDTLSDLDKLWDLPFFKDGAEPGVVLTMDDVDKADTYAHPPLRYSVPEPFRPLVAAPVPDALVASEQADVEEDEDAGGSNTRRLTDWLPQSVQNLLPHVPSLSSLVPTYIPGVNFEAEVHRKPVSLPQHVFPTPSEVKVYVNALVQAALDGLHRKQQQLAELIKCSCPRPARCEGVLQEFLHGIKPSKGKPTPSAPTASAVPAASSTATAPIATIVAPATPANLAAASAAAAAAASAAYGSGSFSASASASASAAAHNKVHPDHEGEGPELSFYAGLSKPAGGQGPGFGFYVDQSGPHLGHYTHHGQHGHLHPAAAPAPATPTRTEEVYAPVPALPQPSEFSPPAPADFGPPSNSSQPDSDLEGSPEAFQPSQPNLEEATAPALES